MRTRIAADPKDAACMAQRMATPVALKILSNEITHKSEAGGVELGLEGGIAVEQAARRMRRNVEQARPDARIEGFSVQEMAHMPASTELICVVKTDLVFGPVILFDAGGVSVEVAKDSAIALPPSNLQLAHRLIEETDVHRRLQGYRNVPAADLEAVARTLVRLARMVTEQDLIDELGVNPLLANA